MSSLASLETPAPATGPSQEELESFIYLIAHDLRNSARALLELPQWIEEDLVGSGQVIPACVAENLALMGVHTRRLDRMLNDLLVHSRVGRMQSTAENDLDLCLSRVLDEMPRPAGIEVVRDLDPAPVVLGQRDVLTLLRVLVANAIKHHDRPDGVIRVVSRAEAGQVELRVIDDGPGIPEQSRERACRLMSTLRPRDEIEGSGMGLAIARKIAEHYGGSLSLGAASGHGAVGGRGLCVTVILPRRPAGPHSPATEAA